MNWTDGILTILMNSNKGIDVTILLMLFISRANFIDSGSKLEVPAGMIIIASVATMFVTALIHLWQ